MKNRKIVIINQAVNYLTIGFCNAFMERFDQVALITGSIHAQGEELYPGIDVTMINKWAERPAWRKMASYFLACGIIWWLLMTKYRSWEVYFVSVPPMGYLLNLLLPHRFSMMIWDVYPDILKVTGTRENHPVYKTWAVLNKRSFDRAYQLFTIGHTTRQLLAQYAPEDKIIIAPIWSIFQENIRTPSKKNPFVREHKLEGMFIVQYSGNIGLTHNVEILIDLAAHMQHRPDILFQIIGRGPRKTVLEKMVKSGNLANCRFLPFQSDDMFPHSLSAADLGVVILDEAVSMGSVPSKSYNLMSLGIPSLYLAGKDSELCAYTQRYDHGQCFDPSELDRASEFIELLADNPDRWKRYSDNAARAAENYRRKNADRLVEQYLAESTFSQRTTGEEMGTVHSTAKRKSSE